MSLKLLTSARHKQLRYQARQQDGHGPSACATQAKAGSLPARVSLTLTAAEEVTSKL